MITAVGVVALVLGIGAGGGIAGAIGVRGFAFLGALALDIDFVQVEESRLTLVVAHRDLGVAIESHEILPGSLAHHRVLLILLLF